ncbi:MAG: PSD1 and planctomycete cytochrome C domain-containing protein [Planctomycetota bacterium]
MRIVIVLLATAFLIPPLHADDVDLRFFENRVRPLLVEKCLDCHGPDPGRREGGLDLSTRESLLSGGGRGPAAVPGNSSESLLFQLLDGHGDELGMPPEGPLTGDEKSVFRKWIDDGLVDPRKPAHASGGEGVEGIPPMAERGRHWAFQPLKDPEAPAVKNTSQVRQNLDAFILASLEEQGWSFAPEADRFTRARRASQVLTGLPLDWQRWREIQQAGSEEALDNYINELLESKAFGEHWARWWLDLARYSDSNGLDENLAFGEAWRYRDYVIRSFNQDKPYDRFLLEQVAGDLLPEPETDQQWRDQQIGTGFLALGPKMLAEQDKDKLAIDIVDEQLDVTGQVFLGMTLGCARCHDHKFDPVTDDDYYAMAGIFRSTSTLENFEFVSRWREVSLETPREKTDREDWESRRAGVEERRQKQLEVVRDNYEGKLLEKMDEQLLEALDWVQRIPGKTVVENSAMTLGLNTGMYGNEQIPLAHTVQGGEQQVTWDLEVLEEGLHEIQIRYTALESRTMKLYLDGELIEDKVLGNVSGTWSVEGLRWESIGKRELSLGKHQFKLVGGAAVPHLDRIRLLPPSYLDSPVQDHGVIAWMEFLQRPSTLKDPLWGAWAERSRQRTSEPVHDGQPEFLTDEQKKQLAPEVVELLGAASVSTLEERAQRWKNLLQLSTQEDASDALKAISDGVRGVSGPWYELLQTADRYAPENLKVELTASKKELDQLDQVKPSAASMALGVRDAEIVDIPVHLRGSHLRLAKEPTPRGVMSVVDNILPGPTMPSDQSGRLQLAEWMLHPEHPLTARVLVNRVWLQLFGEGLVSTPSNFGLRGSAPSHPELLDRLARDFIADGWSIKRLIRKIIDSTAWRQQVISDEKYMTKDPENRLLWSQNRQRLGAEAVRDSVLMVSGQLDREMGGTLLMTGNRGYVTNDQSNNQARYDRPRRSVYLPIIRNAMYELFSAFDYNDPSIHIARRPSTVVPHQALYFLNSPMVLNASERIVDQALAEKASDSDRLDRIYQQILCRNATAEEKQRAMNYFEKVRQWRNSSGRQEDFSDQQMWHSFCQTLLASSEFLYLD